MPVVVRETSTAERRGNRFRPDRLCSSAEGVQPSARAADARSVLMEGHLRDGVIILAAAVVASVGLDRLRLSPVLGYMIVGVAIGPFALHLIDDVESARGLAEFGVVFLLFSIGLELPLGRLRILSPMLFGLAAAQILVTAAVIGGAAFLAGLSLDAAIVVGLALALSSTVFVVRLLIDARRLAGRIGRSAFGILLTQDIAIAPILVVTIAFIDRETGLAVSLGIAAAKAAAAVAVIFAAGHYVLRPLFRLAAVGKSEEAFVATTLLVVLCTAALTEVAGLSLALGGLLAGMLLAETQYRHQVAAEIRPFRGLLVGLFFMTIGMVTDLGHAWSSLPDVAAVLVGILAAKTLVLAGLALLFGFPAQVAVSLGLLLAQGGEFAFVLLGVAAAGGLLSGADAQTLIVAVALSLFVTPMLAAASRRLARQGAARSVAHADPLRHPVAETGGHVIIAGYGRVGRTVAKRLAAAGIPYRAIDQDPDLVGRAQGDSVFFGDATRLDVLQALHIDQARAVVVALPDREAAIRLVGMLRMVVEDRPILARAATEEHARELVEAGADEIVLELIATGDRLARLIPEASPAGGAGGP